MKFRGGFQRNYCCLGLLYCVAKLRRQTLDGVSSPGTHLLLRNWRKRSHFSPPRQGPRKKRVSIYFFIPVMMLHHPNNRFTWIIRLCENTITTSGLFIPKNKSDGMCQSIWIDLLGKGWDGSVDGRKRQGSRLYNYVTGNVLVAYHFRITTMSIDLSPAYGFRMTSFRESDFFLLAIICLSPHNYSPLLIYFLLVQLKK